MRSTPWVAVFLGLACRAWAYQPVLAVSRPDARGRFTVEFSPGPVAIYLADGYREWSHVAPLPAGTVCEVRSFIGWDAGSRGEANLELNVSGYRLYERSEHRQAEDNYDAWRTRAVRFDSEGGELLHLALGACQTAPRRAGGKFTRVEMAVRLRMSLSGSCE